MRWCLSVETFSGAILRRGFILPFELLYLIRTYCFYFNVLIFFFIYFFLLITFIGKDYFNLELGRDLDEGWYDVLLTFDLVETKTKSLILCFCFGLCF